jgi:hypothetical protein
MENQASKWTQGLQENNQPHIVGPGDLAHHIKLDKSKGWTYIWLYQLKYLVKGWHFKKSWEYVLRPGQKRPKGTK